MIRGCFLSEEDRNKLIALARDGSVASRVTRRANALVLLDDGWSCQEIAAALLLNDDTIRGWFKLFEQRGIEGLTSFDMGGSASFLSAALDAPGRCLDRTGIWPRLRKPFGTDRAVASPGARISQAECHSGQARRRQAEGLHREL
jgi:Homeodomain-like domain